ncbi:MAG: hypothetical protein SAK29_08070 [Scytonema sp. PMC 1069.18]|nr:hypothetical protein [Scytonema sp. PMC 1069.18]MEC4884407.1 hypothetical protein [Scytonema sp. PMC 1070.18]
MKLNKKIAVSLVVATASVFGFGSGAWAGEGGAAGAASFTVDSTNGVTGVAVAASSGKQDAAAMAFQNAADTAGAPNRAYALGSAGVITISNMLGTTAPGMTSVADTALNTDQANSLDSPQTINVGSNEGDELVTFGAAPLVP